MQVHVVDEPPVSPPGPPRLVETPPPAAAAPAIERRRVVVRLVGGEEIEAGEAGGRDEALELARGLVQRLARAEADADWAELDGRFLRPGAVVSVDVLKAG